MFMWEDYILNHLSEVKNDIYKTWATKWVLVK